MDRMDFIKKTAAACALCCGLAGSVSSLLANEKDDKNTLMSDLRRRMAEGSSSPAWRRQEHSLNWIKNMVRNLDEMLDEETKIKILNANGRACYYDANGVPDDRPISPEATEGFYKAMESSGVKVERTTEITSVYFGYRGEQNPQGLSLKEGFCLCPIVEDPVPGLSTSFCNCSAGYVKEIVERYSGKKAKKVEVLESVKRGGKDCRFRVDLLNNS